MSNSPTSSRRTVLKGIGLLFQTIIGSSLLSPVRSFAQPWQQSLLEKLRTLLAGKVIAKEDSNYELTRLTSVWQQVKAEKYPALIVQAATVEDVIKAVKFARLNDKKISIRCGGHSYYSSFLQDDVMLLDVSSLRSFSVDSETQTARVQVAMRSVDFMAEIAKHGFSFPAAHCGNVPLGGYLLGGGLGWNGEAWGGMSCFKIREVEVVTAEGRLIRANENENVDYYWAVRGAGPNFFGVVTEFVVDLYPDPKVILTTTLIWDVSRASIAAEWLEKKIRSMPINVEALFILTDNLERETHPDVDRVCIAQVSAFSDTQEEAKKALAPLSTDTPEAYLSKDEFSSTPIADLYQWDATAYPQWRWDVDSLWSDEDAGKLVDKLNSHVHDMPSAKSSILLLLKPHTKTLPDAAFSMIGSVYLACYAIWATKAEDAANRSWVKKTMAILSSETKGHYINESNYADISARRSGSFSAGNFQKLKALSAKYDPDSLFHSYLD